MDPHLQRLRTWILVLLIVAVSASILAPTAVIVFEQRSSSRSQLVVTCEVIRTGRSIVHALIGIRNDLGLPNVIQIPEVPDECTEA